ncbi:hypothetical protein EVAR_84247_1 [Eumeta japonica]|uniref:Uncharacterized protein n=1 Tax=Eumeta variegata TaxID=151549 RepID=A0A4C1WUP2_EUMVA|nr:hypothetical protein EVAR_84247_1 [Eumeta japonica]
MDFGEYKVVWHEQPSRPDRVEDGEKARSCYEIAPPYQIYAFFTRRECPAPDGQDERASFKFECRVRVRSSLMDSYNGHVLYFGIRSRLPSEDGRERCDYFVQHF